MIDDPWAELENLGGIPTVEDIGHWHDTGEVGSLYTWCQAMAEILRFIKGKDEDDNEGDL